MSSSSKSTGGAASAVMPSAIHTAPLTPSQTQTTVIPVPIPAAQLLLHGCKLPASDVASCDGCVLLYITPLSKQALGIEWHSNDPTA
jgi:hypothetical protein